MKHDPIGQSAIALAAFLADLSDISHRQGIAVVDGATLFVIEREDFARTYSANDESSLSFS